MMHCTIHTLIWLVMCDSGHAVLAISRQELQIGFNNLKILLTNKCTLLLNT